MGVLSKNVKVVWLKERIEFERVAFLEGDLNVGKIDLEIIDFVEDVNLQISFYNEKEEKLYVFKEENIQKNMVIDIPNETLQVPGVVYVRMAQEKDGQILQATEEVYFYVVKKKITSS
ncbi:MAG: hypothetical protein ACRC0G_10475 [Fusobacteriaceae bacterium]